MSARNGEGEKKFTVRMPRETFQLLENLCKEYDLKTPSEGLRYLIQFSASAQTPLSSEIAALLVNTNNQIKRVGININQIARATHIQGSTLDLKLERLLYDVHHRCNQTREVIAKFEQRCQEDGRQYRSNMKLGI